MKYRTTLITLGLICAVALTPTAASGKEIFDFFGGTGELGGKFGKYLGGTFTGGVAVNQAGIGPANPGDVYAVDSINNRIQRFGVDDQGTPPLKDDTYFFISAWGADVASPAGGSDYEVCTVAAECRKGVASGGNGTAAGNGALNAPKGIAIDQDTGRVYVSDAGNNRVNVYEGDGAFVRSFGYDVVASGPGLKAAPNEKQRLTVKATGGKFSLSFAGKATGPRGTGFVKKNLTTIALVNATEGAFAAGQGISGEKGIAPGTTITAVSADKLTISQPAIADTTSDNPLYGEDLDFDSSAAEVEAALNALPSIGGVGGSVTVTGGPGNGTGSSPYEIEFGGAFAKDGVPPLEVSKGGLAIGSGAGSANTETLAEGGAYEVCVALDDDVCKTGSFGDGAGQVGEPPIPLLRAPAIAVSTPDGNPASGSVFLADSGNQRVNSYGLDGAGPTSIGSAAVFEDSEGRSPTSVAIDSRGILYAGSEENGTDIERYDTENANGVGVGFLAPIPVGVEERQEIKVAATAGSFRLSFDGHTTGDLPFNAPQSQVEDSLRALPSVGPRGLFVLGGPGDAVGSNPYRITFSNWLGAKDVPQVTVSNGTVPLSGGAGASVVTTTPGQAGLSRAGDTRLAVDPDTDGGGPDTDVLYVSRRGVIQQFGPANAPGLTAPPTLDDARHSTLGVTSGEKGIAIEESTGRLFVFSEGLAGNGVYLTGEAGPPPSGSLDSVDGVSAKAAAVHATIDPNGPPDTSYRFEYSSDGVSWQSTPTVLLGRQEDPQAIEETIEPALFGLQPNTLYHVRLVYQRLFSSAVTTSELTFKTDPVAPLAQTLGAPLRNTTTVQLNGRVDPNGSPAAFHFEYGGEGPCSANPCTVTPTRSAGSGSTLALVAERVEGLEPGATYHYRVIAANGVGAPVAGEDMTATTLASEAPLSHGHFPGPPGSDRAWEMVSLPDSGGNPAFARLFSSGGNRAVYSVTGGTPISDSGSPAGLYFAERGTNGWSSSIITPSREQLIGPEWLQAESRDDLSLLTAINRQFGDERQAIWRFGPGAEPAKLFEEIPPQELELTWLEASEDTSVVAALVKGGTLDPTYPAAAGKANIYDVGAGAPQLITLLPGDAVAPCGMHSSFVTIDSASSLSPDGRFFFFPSQGNGPCDAQTPVQLYVRDLQAGETTLISGPAVSGPDCSAAFVRSTPGAAFFWTPTRLVAEDSAPAECSTTSKATDGDVYRYDLGDDSLACVTCVVAGFDADVSIGPNGLGAAAGQIGVSEDASRVYFHSPNSLLPGAAGGDGVAYRIDVTTGDLAYAGPLADNLGPLLAGATPDGSVLLFVSGSSALNPLGAGTTNGATNQVYRYDDADLSLVCISCPLDGDTPKGQVPPNDPALSDDGDLIAFNTPTPLLAADQNTAGAGQPIEAGADVYEWRQGRLLLITDGLTDWPDEGGPIVAAVSPSGRDVFFQAWAQYTPDALDAYRRVYDARLGGGFTYPKPPPPCPLEVCQGTPKGAPEEQAAGTNAFAGPGNVAKKPPSCRKPKVRRKGRCVAKRSKAQHKRTSRAAKRNGRTHR